MNNPSRPPEFKQLRYDENYEYLRDPARRSGVPDAIKFIPFGIDGYLTIGGEVRERYEWFDNSLWGRGPQDSDGYRLQRYMVHADVHLGSHLRLFTQAKSGLEEGRSGGPRPADQDDFDINQAFLDFEATGADSEAWTLRLGRQELAYGSSRLISFREGPNVRLAFDGIKLIVPIDGWQIDAFAVKPVRTQPGVFDDDPDPGQNLWGLYATGAISWLPGGKLDSYYLGLDRRKARYDQGTGDELRHTIGSRIWGQTAGWDYNFEFVYQFGSFDRGEIRAWTAASDVGYMFKNAVFSPRLGLKANVTSGDEDRTDTDLQTFNPLFPRGAYFGEPALIGPVNHFDVHPQLDLALGHGLTLSVDWDWFWRTSLRDGVYGPAVNLLQSGENNAARFVGHQAQALLTWPFNRHLTVTGCYAHFFAGDFLRETTPGKDVDYLSAWATFRF